MKDTVIKTGRILFFLSIGVFFLFLAFRHISLEELLSGLRSANYFWVMVSLTFAFLAFISRSYRWILLIEPLGYYPSVKNTFYALMTGYLANFVLPRIGEITRCGSLNRTDKIPVDSLMGTVLTERISDLIVLMLLIIYIFFVKIEFFGRFIISNIMLPVYNKIATWLSFSLFVYIIIFVLLLLLIATYRGIIIWLRRYNIFRRAEKIAGSVITGMKSVFRLQKTGYFIIHTIFIWVMYYLMTWALFMALPSTAGLGGHAVLFILVIGGMGMVVPVQGGIGAYHWIVSIGLGLYDISREEGLIFATLSHESQAILMILLGSFSMIMILSKQKKNSKSGESGSAGYSKQQ